ncbi:3-carboxy-cis,cis-muconate cycloisomerase [bacterium HR40]|nr:3-carboxy-cis,cis-muconate cycloisomerase [bacterium HR40]
MYAPALHGGLFDPAHLRRLFDDRARLSAMLAFESALARAEAACGLLSPSHAATIVACCEPALYDPETIGEEAAEGGNPAIPLVRALMAKVQERDPEAAAYVHWGATSQDVIDTATVLCLREALDAIEIVLDEVIAVCAELVEAHRDTLRTARTLLQPALPTTFGFEVAGWLDALLRHRMRLSEMRPRLLVVQLGGAAGTLAALGDAGPDVVMALADALGLECPDLPWHGQRDRIGELAGWLAGLSGSLGKIATDLVLSMQAEVDELREPPAPGRGGSSTLPQKRNPVGAILVRQAALRAPGLAATLFATAVQEFERGAGGWHAEWETLADLVVTVGGALVGVRQILTGLEVDSERMRRRLADSRGLLLAEAVQMALAPRLGRIEAKKRVEAACREAIARDLGLGEVLQADPAIRAALGEERLAQLLVPENYLGAARKFANAVLQRWRAQRRGGGNGRA